MQIAVVIYGPLDRRSGGFLYDQKVVHRLRERGATVDVVSLPERGYLRSITTNLSFKLSDRLADYDGILEDELCHPSLFAVNPRLTDTPVIAIVHHLRANEHRSRARNWIVETIEATFLRGVDGYVYNSTVTQAAVRAHASPNPSVVAPPAGDRFDPLSESSVRRRAVDSPLQIIAVGTVTPRKGLTTLLEGLTRVDSPWRLTVAGDTQTDPDHVSRVRQRAAELGVSDQMSITGRVTDERLAELLEKSHLMAVPSVREGFGIVYLEGMAFGLPAIATTNGGASDFVSHGKNGYLVSPGHPQEVADAVGQLAADRDLLTTLSTKALETFHSHPGWTETGDMVFSFVSAVADDAENPAASGAVGDSQAQIPK